MVCAFCFVLSVYYRVERVHTSYDAVHSYRDIGREGTTHLIYGIPVRPVLKIYYIALRAGGNIYIYIG